MFSTAKVGRLNGVCCGRPILFLVHLLPLEVIMASKTNRSLQRNHLKAVKQRQELGAIEGMKPAYHSDKRALRTIAASTHLVPKMIAPPVIEPSDVVMVPYMPHRSPRVWTAAQRAYVNCGDELVKRADYLKR